MRPAAALVLLLLALALLPDRTAAQSIGFYPSSIEVPSALRGQRYEFTTTLVNQSAEPRIFALDTVGDTARWITFATPDEPGTPIEQLTVPARANAELLVAIAIPEAAPNGDVTGVNIFDGYTGEAFQSRQGLVTGFRQPVRITVTGDQVIDLRVADVSAADTEAGQPLRIRTRLTNNGNVDASPNLAVAFFSVPSEASAAPLDALDAALEVIRPGQGRLLETEWATGGREAGRYRGEYTIELQGQRIAAGSLEFELLPPGTLARAGAITAISVVPPVIAGSVSRADIGFENTGAAEVTATFSGHMMQDGLVVASALSPDPLLVRPGEVATLSAFFEVPADASGSYEIRGRVVFDGFQTDEASAPFEVGGHARPGVAAPLVVGGMLAAIVGAVVVGGAWALRRR